jgi:thiol-disulfide isomerase/thioredoxin
LSRFTALWIVINDKIIHMNSLNLLVNSMLKSFLKKSRNYIGLVLTSLLLSGCSDPDYYLSDGSSGTLNDFKGKWLVINYWADWCPPCIKEMPELSNFYNENKDDVRVFAFNFDELEGEELDEQIVRFKVGIPSMMTNPGILFGWETPATLPATYVLNRDGVLKDTLMGPQTQEGLEDLLNSYSED